MKSSNTLVITSLAIAAIAIGSIAEAQRSVSNLRSVTANGIFDIREGEVIELTAREFLFRFDRVHRVKPTDPASGISVFIDDGSRQYLSTNKTNLKLPVSTRKGDSQCEIDFVKLSEPSNDKPIATFRLRCQ